MSMYANSYRFGRLMYLSKQERFRRLWPVYLSALSSTLIILILDSKVGHLIYVFICASIFGLECFLGLLSGFFIPGMERKKLRILTLLPAMLLFFYLHSVQTWWGKGIDPMSSIEHIGFTSCIIFPFWGLLLFGATFASIALGVRLRQRRAKKCLNEQKNSSNIQKAQ
jgi:hypothetical protein